MSRLSLNMQRHRSAQCMSVTNHQSLGLGNMSLKGFQRVPEGLGLLQTPYYQSTIFTWHAVKGGRVMGWPCHPHRTTLLSLPQGTAPLWCSRRLIMRPHLQPPQGIIGGIGTKCVCIHVGERKAGNTLVLVNVYKCCSIPKVSQLCYRSEYVGIFPNRP